MKFTYHGLYNVSVNPPGALVRCYVDLVVVQIPPASQSTTL